MKRITIFLPMILSVIACDKLPNTKEKKGNVTAASVVSTNASTTSSTNLAATINTVKNPCLEPTLIQGVKQGIIDESKKITYANFKALKLEAMISIIESAEIEFDNITDPEVTPLSQNQKVCSATAVIKNLGNSEGITQNIQYQSKTMYRETGESSQGWQAIWGNLPAKIVNTASSYLRTQLQQQRQNNQADYQKDNTDTGSQATSKNTDEAQSYSQAKKDDQSNNVYQEIVNEENKQKNRAYVEHVMSRIDEYWDVPVKSNGQSLVASFNIAENGAVSDISFKGKADKEFEASLREAIERASPLPSPPTGARKLTGKFSAK
jgi:hypothetical protein